MGFSNSPLQSKLLGWGVPVRKSSSTNSTCVPIGDSNDYYKMAQSSAPFGNISLTFLFHEMYGTLLFKVREGSKSINMPVKALEIGFVCDCENCNTFSIRANIWNTFFGKNKNFWEVDFNKECIDNMKPVDGFKFLHSDQRNRTDISRWISESGGNFNFIIDSEGSSNSHIRPRFNTLWDNALSPGGLYFIEHITSGSRPGMFLEVIQQWLEQLALGSAVEKKRITHAIPKRVKWILCQKGACVIAKCREDDVARCS
eukprot:gene12283-25834_t